MSVAAAGLSQAQFNVRGFMPQFVDNGRLFMYAAAIRSSCRTNGSSQSTGSQLLTVSFQSTPLCCSGDEPDARWVVAAAQTFSEWAQVS